MVAIVIPQRQSSIRRGVASFVIVVLIAGLSFMSERVYKINTIKTPTQQIKAVSTTTLGGQ